MSLIKGGPRTNCQASNRGSPIDASERFLVETSSMYHHGGGDLGGERCVKYRAVVGLRSFF